MSYYQHSEIERNTHNVHVDISVRRCVHRDVPEHSTANPNKSQWVYGDRVTYTCDRGYELSGSAESRCTSSGRWSDPPPTCTSKSVARSC